MKQQNNLNQLLLIFKQKDLALWLSVTRSQLSMYLLGKRPLPIEAKNKLANLLRHQQVILPTNKKPLAIDQHAVDKKVILNNQLIINARQQEQIEKKIKRIEKKQVIDENALILSNYLKKNKTDLEDDQDLLNLLKNKSKNNKKHLQWQNVFKLEIKKTSLKAEETAIKNLLKKL